MFGDIVFGGFVVGDGWSRLRTEQPFEGKAVKLLSYRSSAPQPTKSIVVAADILTHFITTLSTITTLLQRQEPQLVAYNLTYSTMTKEKVCLAYSGGLGKFLVFLHSSSYANALHRHIMHSVMVFGAEL